MMKIMPMMYTYKIGSNVTLSCSAESNPEPTIQWMFNGVYLNHYGTQLQLENVMLNSTGNYTCLFHNTVTSRFSSATLMIWVLGKAGFEIL